PSNQLYSTVTFWPSTQPASLRPLRNALARRTEASADLRLTRATTGNGGCCAGAESGHATAVPSAAIKSRRRIASPQVPRGIVAGQTGMLEVVRLRSSANVRFGPSADIRSGKCDVRFTSKSGHQWSAPG